MMNLKDDDTVVKEVIEIFLKGRKEAERLINDGIDLNIRDEDLGSAIDQAVEQGNLEIVKFLLDNGAEISMYDAMDTACTRGQEDVILLLLERITSIDGRDNADLQEVLEYCLKYFLDKPNKFETIEQILNSGENLPDSGKFFNNSLLIACERGNEKVIDLLLDKGADLSHRDKDKRNALHCAARSKNSDLVEWLLTRKGFNVNEEDGSGNNALSFAARHNNTNVVQVLFKHGAKVMNSNYDSLKPPLYSACEHGNEAIVKLIIGAGADINEKFKGHYSTYNNTSLKIATYKGYENIVELLMKSGATIQDSPDLYESLLHAAVESQNVKLVELFLQHGLKVSTKSKYEGITALKLACRYDNTEIINLLLDDATDINDDLYGSALKNAINSQKEIVVNLLLNSAYFYNINLPDVRQFEDFIHSSARSGNKNITEILIKRGIDVNCKDERGHSVLYHALCSKDKETIKLLLNKGANIEGEILQASVAGSFKPLAERCLQQGLNINWRKNEVDFSALELSVNNFNLFQTLWKYGGSVDSKGKGNVPLLNFACYSGDLNVVNFLLNKGADMTATDPNGINCLIAAVDGGNLEVVRMLLEKGMDLEFRDSFGRTPLTAALTNYEKKYKFNASDLIIKETGWSIFNKDNPKYVVIVEFLLDHGATLDVNNQNDSKNFLLVCENENGYLSKLELLLAYNLDINFVSRQWAGIFNLEDSPQWLTTSEIVQYVMKAHSKGASISEKIWLDIDKTDNNLRSRRVACEKEIKFMKEKLVENSTIPFYEIWTTTDLNQLVEYASNVNILKAFSVHYKVGSETREMFPMYYDEMRYQIKKGLWRKYLLNQTVATEGYEALSNRELQAQNSLSDGKFFGIRDVHVNYIHYKS